MDVVVHKGYERGHTPSSSLASCDRNTPCLRHLSKEYQVVWCSCFRSRDSVSGSHQERRGELDALPCVRQTSSLYRVFPVSSHPDSSCLCFDSDNLVNVISNKSIGYRSAQTKPRPTSPHPPQRHRLSGIYPRCRRSSAGAETPGRHLPGYLAA